MHTHTTSSVNTTLIQTLASFGILAPPLFSTEAIFPPYFSSGDRERVQDMERRLKESASVIAGMDNKKLKNVLKRALVVHRFVKNDILDEIEYVKNNFHTKNTRKIFYIACVLLAKMTMSLTESCKNAVLFPCVDRSLARKHAGTNTQLLGNTFFDSLLNEDAVSHLGQSFAAKLEDFFKRGYCDACTTPLM